MRSNVDLQRIHRLQLRATRHVEDLFAGVYHSAFKGRGLEFEEVREYQPGDDVRYIDWKVTARHQQPYVKSFREERELTVILLIDISASTRYGHTDQIKREQIAEIGAILAFAAIKNHDKVGLILFSDQIELYLQPKKGIHHVLRVIRELLYFQPVNRGTDVKQALDFLGQVQKRRAICFLLSDFLSANFARSLEIIAKRHELIGISVYDRDEKMLPNLGLIHMRDLEDGQPVLIDTDDQETCAIYRQRADDHSHEIKQVFMRAAARLISIRTDQSHVQILRHFFES